MTLGTASLALCADDGHVSVLAAPAGSYLPTTAGQPTRQAVAQQFFSTHSDAYDFLVVFPAFQTGFTDEAGLHTSVRSAVEGLGRPPHDLGAAFGSPSRLKGYIDVRALDPAQSQLSADSAIAVVAHEVEHQFGAYLRIQAAGLAPDALLGRTSAHWSFFFDSDASLLYGSDWAPGPTPGTWKAESSLRRYSALDLYLMGLMAPLEVAPMQLLEPTSSSGFIQTDSPPPDGTLINAAAKIVRMEDIIAANGVRSPGTASSQKSFRAAFILLLPPGQTTPAQAQVDFVDSVRRRFANDFFFMTRGRAVMQTDLLEVPSAPLAATPDIRRAVDYLLARQELSGAWRDSSATQLRDTQLALEALSSFGSDARVPLALLRGGGALSQSALDGVDATARRALGLFAAHQPATSVKAALDSFVDRSGLNLDQGFGYSGGYGSSVLDTLLALQALQVSGAADLSIAPTLSWLLSRQNGDGGWPAGTAGESRVGISAMVVSLLSTQPPASAGAIAASRGQQFLRTRRIAGRGFGDENSLVPTALTLLALDAWGELTTPEATEGASYLLSRQHSDGSFGGSVSETATVIKALRRLLSPNLEIDSTDVTLSRTQTLDGDLVQASVRVRNAGYVSSPPTVLQVVDSSGSPLSPLQTVPQLMAGGAAVISFVLDTTGHGGSSQLFVAVDPEGTVDETREDDNRVARSFQVAPPPPSAELTVGALVLAAPLSSLPGLVSLTAAVHNVGLAEAVDVVVELQVAGQSFRARINLPPRSVTAVPLGLVVQQLATPLVALVTVDPDGLIAEPIEDNNFATLAVPVIPAVQLAVTGLAITPTTANQGQSITVSFSVANSGTIDASDARAEILLKAPDGSVLSVLSAFAIPVVAGAVMPLTVTVRVLSAGTFFLEVRATATGDTSPADNAAAAILNVIPSALANLTVAPGALTISPLPPLQSRAATVTALISNPGATAAGGSTFELWAGAPPGGTRLDRRAVPPVPAGGSTSVTVSWAPASSTPVDLFTRVDADNAVEEYDESDNLTPLRVKARSLADLEIVSGDIQLATASPQAGVSMAVEIFVRNRGEQEADAPAVSLFLGDASTGVLLGTTTLPPLSGGSEAHASFSVSTAGLTGQQELTAVVDTTSTESETNNNQAHRSFTVQTGPVTVSNVYFSPNGDGVRDDTQISFTQATAQAVHVVIADAQAARVREFSISPATTGTATWDGFDDNGRLARDGSYRATVVIGSGTATSALGSVGLVLDVNHSALADAVGTPLLEMELLTAGNPRPTSLLTPAGDDVAFFSDRFFDGANCGIYYRTRGGGPTVRATLSTTACNELSYSARTDPVASPDGQQLAYVAYVQGADETLRLFSRQLRTTLSLAPSATVTGIRAESFPPVFSPDGLDLFFVSSCTSNCTGPPLKYELIGVDGSRRRTLWQTYDSPYSAQFSPDGRSVAWVSPQGVMLATGGSPPIILAAPTDWRPKALPRNYSGSVTATPMQLLAWESDNELVLALGGGLPVQRMDVLTGASTTLLNGPLQGISLNPLSSALFTSSPPGPPIPCAGCEMWTSCDCEIEQPWRSQLSNPVGAPVLPFKDFELGKLSTAGDFMIFPNGFAASSLANLTNRFSVRRGAGEVAFTLSGTLSDVNFDGFEVTARRMPGGVPFVVARGTASTFNGVFGQWVPSTPGLYELRVLAKDLAGNVRTRTTQVVSPDTAVRVSNVQRAPAVVSPNGDGKKDTAEITYAASGPVTFAVDVRAVGTGAVIRTIAQTSLAAGADRFEWDGRSDTGAVAPAGDYLLELEGARVPVAVDVTPPQLALEWNHQTQNGPQEFARASIEGRTCGDPSGPPRTVPSIVALYRHLATDTHPREWTLEASTPFTSTGFTTFATAVDDREHLGALSLVEMSGRSYRLRAMDQADNEAIGVARRPTERLFVLGAYASSGSDLGCVQLPGGLQVPGLDAFLPVGGALDAAAEVRFEALPAGVMAIALTNSIAEPIREVTAEVLADRPTAIPAAVSSDANLIVLDTSQTPADARGPFVVALRATTVTGRIFTTQLRVLGAPLNPAGSCSATAGSGTQRIQIDDSTAVGTIAFHRSSDGVLEQSRPWVGSGSYDTALLTSCRYRVEVATFTTLGQPIAFTQAIDVCGVFFNGASFAGGEVSVSATARTTAPMSSVSVLASVNGGTWNELGSAPGFQGTTTISAPLPSSLGCGGLAVRLIARMADGTTYDSVAAQSPCAPPGPPLAAPCLRLEVRAPARTTTADWCSANVATWNVSAQGNQPLTTLTADLFPLLGQPRTAAPISFTAGQPGGFASIGTPGLAEGAYLVSFTATDTQGALATANLSSSAAIIVDRSPPSVALTTPLGGALCPRVTRSASGALTTSFDVTGTISDDSPERWAVLLRQPNQGAPLSVFEGALNLGGAQTVSATIEAGTIQSGDYELLLGARDVSGGSVCTPSTLVRIQQPVAVAQTAPVFPRIISPDGDGVQEFTSASVNLTNAAQVTLEVSQGSALLGVAFDVTWSAGLHALVWDGTVAGRRVSDGEYRLAIVARDTCSTVARAELAETVVVDTTLPVARIFSPANAAAVQVSVLVSGAATDQNFLDFELSLGAGTSPATWTPLHTSRQGVVSGALGTAAFGLLAPGPYGLRLIARDTAGHSQTETITVQLQAAVSLSAFSVRPAVASPEGDGRNDSAIAQVTLTSQGSVTIELLRNGLVVHDLVAGVIQAAGTTAYPLTEQLLVALGDGPLEARVRVGAEDAAASFEVDSQPPLLAFTQPSGAFVPGRAAVALTATDPHLSAWQLTHVAPDGTVSLIADGTGSVGPLPDLVGLSEGSHSLELRAEDSEGHSSLVTKAFTSDSTSPQVAFRAPSSDAFLSGLRGAQPVSVDVTEQNVAAVRLEWSPSSGATRLVSALTALPPSGLIADWNVLGEADGPGQLKATITDRAGNTADAVLSLTLDSTRPAVSVTSPVSGPTNALAALLGSVTDSALRDFKVLLGQGTPSTATAFVEVGSGSSPVVNGTLARLSGRPPDGPWTLRLRAVDAAGNDNQTDVGIEIDSVTPAPPLSLAAEVQRPATVVLTWAPGPSLDVSGYLVFRASAFGSFVAVTSVPVSGTAFQDVVPADGSWRYVVRAVDAAGNQSIDTNVANAVVDGTPPQAYFTVPGPGATLSGTIEIRGTAFAPDLREYRLSIGSGAAPSSFTLVSRNSVSVLSAALGQLDTAGMPQGSTQTLRLEAEDFAGNIASARTTFLTDNASPAAPLLISAAAILRTVTIQWQAPADSDLRGYLVYRDGALANAPFGQSFADITPYLIPASISTFTETNVSDGTHRYELQAVDLALNLSLLSNSAQVTVELRAPAATVASPLHLARIGPAAQLIASVVDQDVASVQLEVRVHPSGSFVPLGAPRANPPYAAILDATQFPGGEVFEVRAIAEDLSGNRDADPKSIFVFRDELLIAPQVSTLTNGRDVTLSWSEQAAGYEVFKPQYGTLIPSAGLLTGQAAASSEQPGSPASFGADPYFYTRWVAEPGFPQEWEMIFPTPAFVNSYAFFVEEDALVQLSVRVSGAWIPLVEKTATFGEIRGQILEPLQLEGMRLHFISAPAPASVGFTNIQALPMVAASPFVALDEALFLWSYAVRAHSRFGATAEGIGSALVYRPTLAPLASPVPTPSILVNGTGAAPSALVDIAVNGATVAQVSSTGTGAFSATVPLVAGDNRVTAIATDSLGNQSVPAVEQSTRYSPAPVADLFLTLDGVSGADVALSFTTAGPTADVAGFEVRRTTGSVTVTLAALSPSETTYVDSNVPNGTHQYVLVAHNSDGFFGLDSNVVVASLLVPPPLAPTLTTVIPLARGAAVELTWTHPGAPTDYVIERALAPAGGFLAVGNTATTAWRDEGLGNGITLLYRVRARDLAGNSSDPSNVVAATPFDLLPPPSPRFTAPTVPGSPLTVGNTHLEVRGLSEPRSRVELFRNGASQGIAVTTEDLLVLTPLDSAPGPIARTMSPDGTKLAGWVRNAMGDFELTIETLATHQSVAFPKPPTFFEFPEPPVWSPDGTRVVIRALRLTDYTLWALVGNSNSGVLTPLALSQKATFSPDSQRLLVQTPAGKASIIDLTTSLANLSPGAVTMPIWHPGGASLIAVGPFAAGGEGIVHVDLTTWAVTEVRSFADPISAVPVLDPTGRWLAVTTNSSATGTWALTLLDLTTGAALPSESMSGQPENASWAPDGTVLSYTSGGHLFRNEPGGVSISVAPIAQGRLVHFRAHEYWFDDDNQFQRAVFGGQFIFPNVPLVVGLNGFHVVARDTSGNTSLASDSIVVTSSPGAPVDLSVSLQLQPAAIQPGAALTALVAVANAGPAGVASTVVAVTLIGADGSVTALPDLRLSGVLAAGRTTAVLVSIPTAGLSGSGHRVLVVVDPALETNDSNRANNRASADLAVIAPGAQPSVAVSLALSELTATSSTTATILVSNPGAATQVSVAARLLDAAGVTVASLGATEIFNPLAGSASVTLVRSVDATGLAPGDYTVEVRATEGPTLISLATAPVRILTDRTARVTLSSRRTVWQAGETVVLDAVVFNDSLNASLAGATLDLLLSGGGVPHHDSATPGVIAPGSSATLSFVVPASALGSGAFLATTTLRLGASVLASTTASFSVSSSALLVGTLGLSGPGAPPATRRGNLLVAMLDIFNVGTAPSAAQSAKIEFVERLTGTVIAAQSTTVGTLARGGGFQGALTEPTLGWALGPYLATLTVEDQGVRTLLASSAFELVDGAGPRLVVLSPPPGAVVGSSPPVQLSATDDSSGVAGVQVSVDGASASPLTLASGSALSGMWVVQLTGLTDGAHVLRATAVDAEGNFAAPLTWAVIVDTLAPLVQLLNVADGASYGAPLAPVWVVTDDHFLTATATLDGLPFIAGTVIAGEGHHRLDVVVFDAAGNLGRAVASFDIDTAAPTLTLTGVRDGLVSAQTVIPRIVATDRNLAGLTLTLDGVPFVSGTPVAAEGDHLLTALAVDVAGHQQTLTVPFSIDRTAPLLAVGGFTEGAVTRLNVTPSITASDLHLVGVELKLNGTNFVLGSTVTVEGSWRLEATAVDAAGNQANAVGHFTIDRTSPLVTILGVNPGDVSRVPVVPTIQTEAGAAVTARLDGAAYQLGTAISAEGAHVLQATAVDPAGNTGVAQVSFSIDTAPPVITFAGVTDGAFYAAPVSVQAFATDAHPPVVITLTLDAQPLAQGAQVQSEGPHTLSATATDAAGNLAVASISFTLDFAPPALTVTGIAPNGVSGSPVALAWTAIDASPVSFIATLDGLPAVSGVVVSTEGPHLLTVVATDAAANAATRAVPFVLDLTPPVITIAGAVDGTFVAQAVTLTLSASDVRLLSVSATLDGATFTSGSVVSSQGAHELVVVASDTVGNLATRRVGFTLDSVAPVITVSGVTDGEVGLTFSPTFSVTDASTVTVTAQLDGSPFTSGSLVQAAGAHTLVVSAVDRAGNTSSASVHFTVSAQSSRPSFHYAACGISAVRVDNGSQVRGVGGASGSIASNGTVTLLNNAQVRGDLVAGRDVSLSNNAWAAGRAYYGGVLTLGNNASLAQGSTHLSTAPAPCACTFDMAATLTDVAAHNDNQLLTGLAGLSGRRLIVSSGTLTLPAGRFSLSSLEVRTNARLTTAPGVIVELYVDGAVQVRNNAFLGAALTSPPLLVVSGATGTTAVELRNNAVARLLMYAPQAQIELQNNATLYGAVVGRDVHLSSNQTLILDGLTQVTPPPLVCQ